MSISELMGRARQTFAANLAMTLARCARGRGLSAIAAEPVLRSLVLAATLTGLTSYLFDISSVTHRPDYPDALMAVARFLTELGLSGWYLVPTGAALIMLLFRYPDGASSRLRLRVFRWNLILSYIFIGVGLPSFIATLLKRLIGRARPIHFADEGPYHFEPSLLDATHQGFPSGHSTTIGALAIVLALLMPRYRIPFLLLALAVGASRVMVRAHYPADVVAGLTFGAAGAYLIARLAGACGLLFLDNKAAWPQIRPAHRIKRLLE